MGIIRAIGGHEFRDMGNMIRKFIAEFLGTFLLLAIQMAGVDEIQSPVGYAIANGLLIASVIAYVGHISGGHCNPAVTIGMLTSNNIRLLPAICYWIAQTCGSLLGQLVGKSITDEHMHHHQRRFNLKSYLSVRGQFCLEILETFLLVSVAVSVSDPKRHVRGLGSSALAIGFSMAASLCAVTEYRGTMNPAVCFATAVKWNYYKHQWVCSIGPLIGGFLAGIVYRSIISYRKPSNVKVIYKPTNDNDY